jgi:TnpA family transposase
VPVDFLTGGQVAAYGRYSEQPSVAQLERFFHLDDRDRSLIGRRRGDHNRLGFAVQLGTVRFLGTFLARPADVPEIVARRVAEEIDVADPGSLRAYARREPTHREHAGEIQREYGYRDFTDPSAQAELSGWLDARAWATAERPSVLFDLATARLIEAKVLLPGASVLGRAVASARDRAAARLHRTLADPTTPQQQRGLEQLLQVPAGAQLSRLEVLRAGPRKLTASEAAEAFQRVAAVCEVGVGGLVHHDVPAGRLRTLARYGLSAKAQTIRRMSPDRRTATLLAALWQLELDATDDALILLDQVTDVLLLQATREHKDRRYAQLPDLDRAARRLRAAVLILLDPPPGGIEELWSAITEQVSRDQLQSAAAAVQQLASEPDAGDGQDAAFRGELLRRYQSLRRFLPIMLDVVSFEAAPAGRPVLDALESLRSLEGRPGRVTASSVALEVVTGRWRRLVLANPQLGDDEIDRRAYSFCALEALRGALKRRDVFVTRSGRFTDPRAKLLAGPPWTSAKPEICAALNLSPEPEQALQRLGAQLDGAWRETAERQDDNVALEIAELAGTDRPDLSKLEAMDQPEPLSTLRSTVESLLPDRVAFSEVLLEVCRWTGFADAFTHLSEGNARVDDLATSVCAVLLAEACNISLSDVAQPGIAALSYNRLSWVSQNYVRAETIAAANELLLAAYRRIPLVQVLGDGHIATVDGMRFQVPVRSIHSGANPRYFSRGRGVTWLNYMSDQFAGLHAIVVPGTLRDSLMILDGLLELQPPGDGGPTIIITDQASYSDQIFGLFWLLGYQFAPRPAGLPDQRFWRLALDADYGPLDRLARHRITPGLIAEQWEDILRVAGSLSTGTVRASELLRVLQGGGRPTRLGRAIAELGRIAKTLHLLSWIDSEQVRRTTSIGLNHHEGRHSVARIIFHGNRGELRQPYREGQEDQLGALGFALNALVLWNAQYMDDAVAYLRAGGHEITDEDLKRLSPLQHKHIKMLGNFPFILPRELAAGQRRGLRQLKLGEKA